jgi:SAM-dependent methyltransferase
VDPTERFRARADVYAEARPSYPRETIDHLRRDHQLGDGVIVADVGSGTGIWTRLLLDAGATVYAVEPNADMRKKAETLLGASGEGSRFRSVDGRAEATTLPDASVDLVTAAQAFHWFDADAFHREVVRILKPAGRVALVWNDRDLLGTSFLLEYEAILVEHCPGYAALQGKSSTPEKFDALFGVRRWIRHTAPNRQRLDREGLVARALSSSYAPPEGGARTALIAALHAAFDRSATGAPAGVELTYMTTTIGGTPIR